MWHDYFNATSIDEVLTLLNERGARARIVAGATDLILELERGIRTGIDTLIDITRIPGLDQIILDEDEIIHLGPLVTHNHCVASKLIQERAFALAQAAWEVGAPQIRNRGSVAGNLITASPANDTITPLMALGAQVRLKSVRGERVVPLSEFYTGVRRTVMEPDEMLVDIAFPALNQDQSSTFIKLGLRRAQAIAVVNAAVVLEMKPNGHEALWDREVAQVQITLGAVAPTILHAHNAEVYLAGRKLTQATIAHTAELAMEAARPIDDVRSTAAYRREMARVCVVRALEDLANQEERARVPADPVLLWGKEYQGEAPVNQRSMRSPAEPIVTEINGQNYTFTTGHEKTLLHLLRDEAGLIGSKEGCAEGECGACTVFLDGMAVMSCLVPAPRAHGARIVTIEGLAQDGDLHPVQQTFIEEGAVQCGYCTPGFIMSAAKLLEERPHPTRVDVQTAITGNLCRCTGYYKIVQAIERAGQKEAA
ncbi:MAG TPA: FAD binding domain-containing protein [Anaerolineales bacterium]|nr:FAD binding domain-containing protein [Anaerolineales bacterium]